MKDLERNKATPRKDWNLLSSSFVFLPLAYTDSPLILLAIFFGIIILCVLYGFVSRFVKVLIGSNKAIENGRFHFRLTDTSKELVHFKKGAPVAYKTEKKKKVSFFGRTIQSGEVMIGNAPKEDGWIIKAIIDMDDKQLKAFIHGDDIEMEVIDLKEDMRSKRLDAPEVFEE